MDEGVYDKIILHIHKRNYRIFLNRFAFKRRMYKIVEIFIYLLFWICEK